MEILIKIKEGIISLILRNKKKVLDKTSFEGEYQLSERLLPEIDGLLKKNKLGIKDIKKIKSEVDVGKSFTTYRIAKAVEKAWNYCNSLRSTN